MRIALILVGDELLDGRVSDLNGQRLARALAERGARIDEQHGVRDHVPELVNSLEQASLEHDVIFVSGGLGATRDDLTREGLASWLGVHLVEHAGGVEQVRARVLERGHLFTDALRRHAVLPQGAQPIANPVGLAIGIAARRAKTQVFALPGVPSEFAAMLPATLDALSLGSGWQQRHLVLYGTSEREVEERLDALATPLTKGVVLGICASEGVIDLTLSSNASCSEDDLTRSTERLCATFADFLVARDMGIAEAVGAALTARKQSVATAESCTGGLIASMLTDVAGSSTYFLEGCVAYSNDAKMARLGVTRATLEAHGAVSAETVREMAEGIRSSSGADWGVATSGVAGPGGGSPDKPVGTVHLAVAGPRGTTTLLHHFPRRSRLEVKQRAALAALVALLRALE